MTARPTLRTLAAAAPGTARLVPRPALADRLAALAGRRLTLLAAPTGYGKTTLLDEWCRREPRRVVRIELEPRDAEPHRLWQRLGAGDGGLPELVDALADAPAQVLVLDDVHALRGACDDALGYLAERLPEHVSLVLACRTAPRLPLGSLPTRGEVGRLGATDLRLDRAELADAAGVAGAELDELERRTEGWPAAVRLAVSELRDAGTLDGFSGRAAAVAGYLEEELLAGVAPELRRFLAEASVLGRLEPSLCGELLDRDDAAERLDDAERAGLLLPCGDSARLHPLVAELLSADLRPARRGALHRRAATLFDRDGEVAEAVRHAVAGSGAAAARTLLLRRWRDLAAHERVPETRRALAALGRTAPPLAVAWAAADGRGDFAGPLPFGTDDPALEAAVVRAWFGGDDPDGARRALALADGAGDPLLRAAAAAGLAHALLAAGQEDEAVAAASPLGPATAAVAPAPTVRGLAVRALACARLGRPAAAEGARRSAVALVARHGLEEAPAARLLAEALRPDEPARPPHRRATDLSAAELSVLRLLPTALTQREIGRELFLSLNTVKTHAASIYRKLGVASRAEAVVAARRLNLLPG